VIDGHRPIGQRVIGHRQPPKLTGQFHPPGDGLARPVGAIRQPRRRAQPEVPIAHPAGIQLAEQVQLGRLQGSAGGLQVDHPGAQLGVRQQAGVDVGRLAAPLRQLRRVVHMFDSSSELPPDQSNYRNLQLFQ
jgi:hypothetical protein